MNWKEIIKADFPLSALQEARLEALDALYREWNAKINVISRKDIDALYEHHVWLFINVWIHKSHTLWLDSIFSHGFEYFHKP